MTQVMGETVRLGTRKLAAAGVIREEENVLLMPMEGGIIRLWLWSWEAAARRRSGWKV